MIVFYLNNAKEDIPTLSENENFEFIPKNKREQIFERYKTDIIGIGGNLSPGMLISGYKQGFFPWFNSDEEGIRWHNPEIRFVILPQNLHIPKSLEKEIKRNERLKQENSSDSIILRTDTDFRQVITNCAKMKRVDQNDTWITPNMIDAYCHLHELGFAHSYEAWQQDELVGGFYGVKLKNIFFGESMFTKVSNSTKIVFAQFARSFFADGGAFIDCQAYTDNMARYGACNISRQAYLRLLSDSINNSLFV